MNLKYLAIAALALGTITSGWCNLSDDCDRATQKQCGTASYSFCEWSTKMKQCVVKCNALKKARDCNPEATDNQCKVDGTVCVNGKYH